MDFYAEPAFFVLVAPIVAIAVVLGVLELPRQRYVLAASALMLVALFFRSVPSALFALAYIAGSLALYLWVRAGFAGPGDAGSQPAKAAKATGAAEAVPRRYWVALALELAPLVVYKVGVAVRPDFLGFVGISYITFKALQVIIECRDGLIRDMTASEYLLFLAFFPTFTSGPILRSRPFVEDLRAPLARDAYLERLYRGIGWFTVGLAYKFVGAALAQWAMWFVPSATTGALSWLARTLFFGLDLFFDFAGYSDMACGVGLALGIEVPLNFHAPFAATDIKEFWDRWHMSLSTWLRDFVFMRFSRFALERRLFANRQVTACVAFVLDMALMGVWHGITVPYIAYGLFHGVLLAAYHWYQQKSAFYKANRRKRWYRALSWAVTMVAVFFGFALFAGYVV